MPLTPSIYYNDSPAIADDDANHDLLSDPAIIQEGSSGYINTGNTSDSLAIYISHSHDDFIYDCKWFIRDYDNTNTNSAWGQGSNGALGKAVGDSSITFPLTITASGDIKILLDGGGTQAVTNIPLTNMISASPIADISTAVTNLQSDIDAVFSDTASGNTGITVSNSSDVLIITSDQYLDDSEINLSAGTNNDMRSLLGISNANETKSEYANVVGGNATNAKSQSASADLAEIIAWADTDTSNIPGTGKGLFASTDSGSNYIQVITGTGDSLANAIEYNGGDSSQSIISGLDIDTITFQSTQGTGSLQRITFNSSPDLSTTVIGDKITCADCTSGLNNGTFVIIAVNDGSDYVDVYNGDRTDDAADEATDAPGSGAINRYDRILEFDYAGGDTDGEGLLNLQISVPSTEPETGLREIEWVMEFTYN